MVNERGEKEKEKKENLSLEKQEIRQCREMMGGPKLMRMQVLR